jgi:hypothetical protein
MNKAANIVSSATAGITMMTLFSYLVSLAADKNFSEPEHLGTLIHRLVPGNSKKMTQVAGWGAHYAVGLLFVLTYQELWKTGRIKKSIRNGGHFWGAKWCTRGIGLESHYEKPSGTTLDRFYQILYPAGARPYRLRRLRDTDLMSAGRKCLK